MCVRIFTKMYKSDKNADTDQLHHVSSAIRCEYGRALAGYLLTVCRLDFRLWVLATRAHTRGVRLPLQTLTSLDSGTTMGLLSWDCCTLAPAATLWCPDREAWFAASTYSVRVTSAVPPDSRGIAFCRK